MISKNELREQMKKKRRMLTKEEIIEKSEAITDRLFCMADINSAETIMVYLSAFKEPNTLGIIKKLEAMGKNIVVPVSDTDTCTITPSYIDGTDELAKGAYGILEPTEIKKAKVEDIDIVLVPGLAFDEKCHRCGFGKGYYDRLLYKSRAKKVALCYDFQVISEIETDKYDIPMDCIITERRTIDAF